MFTIAISGTRTGVIKAVKAAKDESTDGDPKQLESAKDFIIAEIQALPPEFNGVTLNATGNATASGRSLAVSVSPQKVAV